MTVRAGSSTALPGPEQKLGGAVPALGELRIVARLIRRFEIGAAVLPVGIDAKRTNRFTAR